MSSGQPLLQQRDFRAFLGARLTNSLAVSALTTVVAFQTYQITHDPLSLGWLGLVEAIPALALVLFGGHVADRRDRRSIILLTSAGLTLGTATLAALAAADLLGLGLILVLIFLTGVASGFERPALVAFEAQIIPRDQATRGISLSSSFSLAGSILGPVIGGVSVAVFDLAPTYGAIAVLLSISTGCVFLIERKPMPEPVEGEPFLQGLLIGIRYVAKSPPLLGSMALDLFAVFFGGAIALLPVFASDVLHVGAAGLGVLRTAPSIGALLVMVVATRWPPSRHAGRTFLICVAGFGVSMIVFGLSTSFWLSMAALFMSGVTDGISMVIRSTILRVLSPEAIRGRVAAVNWVFIGASNELGAFESGVAARLLGTVTAVVAGGVFTLGVVAAIAVLVPGLRNLDLDRAEPPDPDVGMGRVSAEIGSGLRSDRAPDQDPA